MAKLCTLKCTDINNGVYNVCNAQHYVQQTVLNKGQTNKQGHTYWCSRDYMCLGMLLKIMLFCVLTPKPYSIYDIHSFAFKLEFSLQCLNPCYCIPQFAKLKQQTS